MSASKPEISNRLDQLIENSILVDVAEFESMLVSNQNLERCDFRSDNTRGVYDPESRTRYFVAENDLFSHGSIDAGSVSLMATSQTTAN